jgi:hypothetical protein
MRRVCEGETGARVAAERRADMSVPSFREPERCPVRVRIEEQAMRCSKEAGHAGMHTASYLTTTEGTGASVITELHLEWNVPTR